MNPLAMFPLGSVVLPGRILTLHVFEPRYRALVQHCLAQAVPEFGVVLIERGSEVGGGDERREVGTVVQMVQVGETSDGRYAVMAVGTRRVRVERWLADDPFPLADVSDFADTDDAMLIDDDQLAELTSAVRRSAALALELGDPVGDPSEEISPDPEVASYQLAAMAPLADTDRYKLLCVPSTAERLRRLAGMVADIHELLQFRLQSP